MFGLLFFLKNPLFLCVFLGVWCGLVVVFFLMKKVWSGILFFFVFVSGVLILCFYMLSLDFNFLKETGMKKKYFFLMGCFLLMDCYLYFPQSSFSTFNVFNMINSFVMLFLVIFLLLVIWFVKKMLLKTKGVLRP